MNQESRAEPAFMAVLNICQARADFNVGNTSTDQFDRAKKDSRMGVSPASLIF
jgi:hypothetical protein